MHHYSLTAISHKHGKHQVIIKQVYVPYWEWEDFINGMWSKSNDEEKDLKTAIEFTGDHLKYGAAMKRVIIEWPRTMLNSLTNPSINKRAFLGHCAVCLELKIPEYITRQAWKRLTDQQRYDADQVAQETINEWTKQYGEQNKPVRAIVGETLLF